jgi:hypothetical protein
MRTYEEDEDLPWDPLWEYVLGEEDEKPKGSWWRRKKVQEDPGIMSYLFPQSETRDEHGQKTGQDILVEMREDDSSSGLVRRNSKAGSELLSSEQSEKSKKFWKRGKKSKNFSQESNSWVGEWELDPAITSAFVSHSESDKIVKPQGSSGSFDTKRTGNNAPRQKMKNKRRENNSFSRTKSNESDFSKKSMKHRDPQRNYGAKSTRRVRFAPLSKSSKDEESRWVDTDKIAAELQNSQKSFLEWVGITGSSDEEDETPIRRRHAPMGVFKDSSLSQNRSVSSQEHVSESPFSFGSLLNDWGDLSSSEESGDDDDSYAWTDDSFSIGEHTDAETTITSEDSQTTATHHSEIAQPVEKPAEQQDDDDRNYNEVRLTFQPLPQPKENSTNLLPAMDDDGSAHMEKHLFFDENSQDSGTKKVAGNRAEKERMSYPRDVEYTDNSQSKKEELRNTEALFAPVEKRPIEERPGGYDAAIYSLEVLDQTREPKGFCCSIKNLTRDQAKWSAKSGLPFHELSQKELYTIFPKIRSVRDDQNNSVTEVIGTSNNYEVNFPAHLQTSLTSNGPQSILEYEYEKGVHMFVTYKQFGSDARSLIQVETAPTPPPKILKGNSSQNKVMIQVEVS